ncbi:DNA gyrase inhibitor YacG [Betaproteobacteria bacterium]|nr:DNA gyrase inhibitor YacG [Betaproteobacteria bacterium]
MNANAPQQVPCPQCGKRSAWNPANPWRPFCSERCKLVDLGAWANEAYKVPDESEGGNQESDDSDFGA